MVMLMILYECGVGPCNQSAAWHLFCQLPSGCLQEMNHPSSRMEPAKSCRMDAASVIRLLFVAIRSSSNRLIKMRPKLSNEHS